MEKFKDLVRETTFKVIKKAKEVKINFEKIDDLAKKIKNFTPVSWPKNFHFQSDDIEKMLTYLIVLDSLNFCFWSKKKKWHIFYQGKKYSGYFALSLSLKKFFEENEDKANFHYFSNISFKEFLSILNGDGELLLLKERWKILKAVSQVFVKRYKKVEDFVLSAQQKASLLVFKIFKELPFFDDFSYYFGEKIYFLKRAQILVADIFGAFDGKGIGYFKDLDFLTAFSDYKLPQILHHFNILNYSEKLEKKIERGILIKHNSREEIEIRASTIWAIEYLKESLNKKIPSFYLDWFLWNKSQKLKMKPHHLTKTIFY
jgi:hypothetical protein